MKQINIALLVYDLRASGVVRNAIRIGTALRAAGCAAELWVVRDQGDMRAAVPPDLPVRAFGGARLASRSLDSFGAVFSLSKCLIEAQPAMLFSTGNHAHLLASIACRLAKKKGSRTLLSGRASNALVSLGVLTPVARAIERFQYREMAPLIAVSNELGRALIRDLALPGAQIAVIPNGVSMESLQAHSAQPLDHPWFDAGQPPVILGIGRLGRQKNFPLLLRAFAQARIDRPLRLVILGKGPEAEKKRLYDLAKRLGVSDDVQLVGYDPNPWRYLHRAALYVLSSRWEGASNTLIEALACGCPVVATACPTGVREVLQGGVGPLVPLDDERALAKAILARLDAPRDADGLRHRAADFDLGGTLLAYARILGAVIPHRH